MMSVDDSGVRALNRTTTGPQPVQALAWSSDSQSIPSSMSTDDGATFGVFMTPVAAAGEVQLTHASGRALVLVW